MPSGLRPSALYPVSVDVLMNLLEKKKPGQPPWLPGKTPPQLGRRYKCYSNTVRLRRQLTLLTYMVSREAAPTPEGQQVSARMHSPAGPAVRSRPGMSTGRITAAALQMWTPKVPRP